MKKKQIIVQERCLACGNGSAAMPHARVNAGVINCAMSLLGEIIVPAQVREDKEHASGPAGFKAAGSFLAASICGNLSLFFNTLQLPILGRKQQ